MSFLGRISHRGYILITLGAFAAFAAVLAVTGQPIMCACGYIELWHGTTPSTQSSQHLTDWYTFSHIIHGILFYWLLWLAAPHLPVGKRFLIALGIEMGWELIENTDMVIEYYRTHTVSIDYAGDSVVNAVVDVAAMVGGFFFARRAPIWASITLIIFLEALAGVAIRDNLLLNIIMFIHPFEAIKAWQSAG